MSTSLNTANIVGSDGMPATSLYDSGSGALVAPRAGTISTDSSHSSNKYGALVTQLADAAGTNIVGVDSLHNLQVTQRASNVATYSANIIGLVPAASATDIFTLTGAAATVVRITRLLISATTTAATAAAIDVVLLKRSTANSAGTATQPTVVPFDSGSAAAAGVVNAYTANPTTGTLVGNLFATRLIQQLATYTATDFPGPGFIAYEFGRGIGQPIILRAATEVFAVNLNGTSAASGSLFDISIEWVESAS